MKKLVLSALALGAMTSVAMAGEAVKLTPSQMDQVAAGVFSCNIAICTNFNLTTQTAVGVGVGGCNGVLNCNVGGASGNGIGAASNFNATAQAIF
jgi:hypothetical protein